MTNDSKGNNKKKMVRTGAIIIGDHKGYKPHPLSGPDELRLDRMFGFLDAAINETAKMKRAAERKAKK
ncbi:hypothetical protein [Rhizobium sp. 21-4511-3d]